MKIIAGTVASSKLSKTEKNVAKKLATLISKEYKDIDNAYEKAEIFISLYKDIILNTAKASKLYLDEDDIEITDIKKVNFNNRSTGVSFKFRPSQSYIEAVRENLLADVEDGEPPVTYDGDELSKDDIMNLDDDEIIKIIKITDFNNLLAMTRTQQVNLVF